MNQEHPKSILIVDDAEGFHFHLRDALISSGHEIVSAESGAAACRMIGRRHFALILLDLRLSDMSGLDVLEAAHRIDPTTVGIVLTAPDSVNAALEALQEGAYDYLVKPCLPGMIQAITRRGMEYYNLKHSLIHRTSDVKKLDKQLSDKSILIQNLSHELKNPLTVIYGYSAHLLQQEPGESTPEDMHRNLQLIHKNAERLEALLEELLEYSRLAANKIELTRASVPARQLLTEAADNIRFEALKKEIEIRLDIPQEGNLAVLADSHRVHQIFSNLLTNALKFTPEGGTITLSARLGEGFMDFCVKDTGVGIAEEHVPHLFERFYQANETRKTHRGLGLGLEITKNLVEMHGGTIWVESQADHGSSFYFSLPLSLRHESVSPWPIGQGQLTKE